jgi:hypothetical protein
VTVEIFKANREQPTAAEQVGNIIKEFGDCLEGQRFTDWLEA